MPLWIISPWVNPTISSLFFSQPTQPSPPTRTQTLELRASDPKIPRPQQEATPRPKASLPTPDHHHLHPAQTRNLVHRRRGCRSQLWASRTTSSPIPVSDTRPRKCACSIAIKPPTPHNARPSTIRFRPSESFTRFRERVRARLLCFTRDPKSRTTTDWISGLRSPRPAAEWECVSVCGRRVKIQSALLPPLRSAQRSATQRNATTRTDTRPSAGLYKYSTTRASDDDDEEKRREEPATALASPTDGRGANWASKTAPKRATESDRPRGAWSRARAWSVQHMHKKPARPALPPAPSAGRRPGPSLGPSLSLSACTNSPGPSLRPYCAGRHANLFPATSAPSFLTFSRCTSFSSFK